MSIRLLLVDDHPLVRSGLRSLLESEPDLVVVGEASDGEEAVREATRLRPDVVLMDLRMPGRDGIQASRQIAAIPGPEPIKVLIVTMFELDEDVVEAVRAGVRGYLLKGGSADKLIEAVRVVAGGGAVLAPTVTRQLLDHAARSLPPLPANRRDSPLHLLSDREEEVLRLLAHGMSNAEIANELALGEATVKSHVSGLLAKLGLRDRLQAVVFAYSTGVVEPAPGDYPTRSTA
jgi:DNA-binding NarL/FixJ family response regulator